MVETWLEDENVGKGRKGEVTPFWWDDAEAWEWNQPGGRLCSRQQHAVMKYWL